MAETDELYELGREPGFSSSVFDPDSSHMLHMEVPQRCQLNALSLKDTKLSKLSINLPKLSKFIKIV